MTQIGSIYDCHAHIFGPAADFPVTRPGPYGAPPLATFAMLQAKHRDIDCVGGVLIQPIEYGDDARCLLQALAQGEGRYRGVLMDGSAAGADLPALHAAGVRGFRAMFPKRLGLAPSAEVFAQLADTCRAMAWPLRVLASPAEWPELFKTIAGLRGVQIVIEHLAVTPAADEANVSRLEDLLRRDHIWMQLSGVQRLGGADMLGVICRYFAAAPERCVWGGDWPHIGAPGVTIEASMAPVREALTPEQARAVFKLNPARLYDFE